MALTVVICGLVRRPDLMQSLLVQLADLRAQGLVAEVYYSTWLGEVERYPELHAALEAAGVALVEAPEPAGYSGPSHVYLQTAVLRRVVERLDPDRIVLRLRPDILFPHRVKLAELCVYLQAQIGARATPLGGLRGRIFAGAFSPTHPFWLEDRYFAGCAGDLLQLAHTDLAYDHFAHPSAAIAEVRWFSRPFVESHRAMREALRVNWLLECDRTPGGRGEAFCALLARNADLQRMLAIYHHILERSFVLGLPPDLLRAEQPPDNGEPMPARPDALAAFANGPYAGPAYRTASASLKSSDEALGGGFADEATLAHELLALGCALPPALVWRGAAAGLAAPAADEDGMAWGATPYTAGVKPGEDLDLAFAWRRRGPGGAFAGPVFELRADWLRDGAHVHTSDPVRLEGPLRLFGERHVRVGAPPQPGRYALCLTLFGAGGRQVDAEARRFVTVTD